MTSRRISSLLLCTLVAFGCTDPKPTTGSLVVSINGLPAGAPADIRVTGPNSFAQTVTTTTTLENLQPGDYIVSVRDVTHANFLYAANATQTTRTVTAGATQTADAPYALASGAVEITVSGLPTGIGPSILLIGTSGAAAGYSRSVLTSGIIGPLPPGQYTVRSDTLFTAEGDRFGAGTFLNTLTITPSLVPQPVNVVYAMVSGSLAVTIEGIAVSQTPPPVTINGPGGFVRNTATSVTYRGLNPGTYTISAASTGSCPSVFTPSASSQTADVVVGATAARTVAYTQSNPSPASMNLRIDGAHLVQITQNYQGTVPMISNRPALLRVFGLANQCNSVTPKVRLTLSGGTPIDLNAGETLVRTSTDQGVLASSWNYTVPASLMQPGLSYSVEIDPDNAIAEANETDNRFPATGARTVEVRAMTPTGIRIVPVTVTISGESTTGRVDASNVDQFMEISRKLHPVHSYDLDMRAPYTASRNVPFQSNDQNTQWVSVLNEIRALRLTDSAVVATGRYYYGVVRVTYNSGVAGIGFIGQKAGIGWDYLPSASGVLAHELGHNFGRFHAPCGGAGGPDQNYPSTGSYAGGYIGAYGYDMAASELKAPQFFTDLMGYCNAQWISDYTYMGMMNFIHGDTRGPTVPTVSSSAIQPSILVWGRIVNGEPVLEPTFEINARTEFPTAGAHRLVALDESGNEILGMSFGGDRVADLPGDNETFAFTIPKSALRGRTLASLRLTARGKTVRSTPSAELGSEARMTMSRVGPRAVRMQWDAARFPVVMVRDPVRGEVLSFARGGDATINTDRDDLELVYSNRVRSTRQKIRVSR